MRIPRTVLAWRLDPSRAWRKPHVGTLEGPIVVVCAHGYSWSLAAYTLVQPSAGAPLPIRSVGFDPFDQVGFAELREPDGSGDLLAAPSAADWEAEAYPGSAFAALNVYSAA